MLQLPIAHGLVGREDLPLPPWLFAWGAAAVLVVSFVGLAVLWTRPQLQGGEERRRFGIPRWVEMVLGAAGVGIFALSVYAGFEGTQTETANITPTLVFVIFWVAMPIVSVALGDIFQFLSPWRAVGRACGGVARRLAGGQVPAPLPYPERLGRWPAVAGLLAFGWVELVASNRTDPSFLATLALVYAAVQLIGMSAFGEKAWTENGDAFGGLFALCGRLSPLAWHDRALFTRRPLSGVPQMATGAGAVALLCVFIGNTAYDGFSQGAVWLDVAERLQRALNGIGLNDALALQTAGTVGLLACVAVVYGFYRIGIDGVRSVSPGSSSGELALAFAHTLVPIGVAYLVAHYVSLLAFQGQAIVYLVSDPLGRGSDLFGTADRAIDYTWLSSTTIWYLQVAALVCGHIVGLVLAHDRALARFRDPREATRSQYWMLAVMVGFTSLGLWLLSATG